jgi:hypothetical protein
MLSKGFRLFFYTDLHGVRVLLALAELTWAVTLGWPGDTFGRPTYTAMSHVMSEEAWALVFALSGMTQVTLLVQDRLHDRFAQLFAAWNSILWIFVCISMYMSVYPPPAAISGEFALAFGASWVFIRTGYVMTGKRSSDGRK